MTPDYRSGYVRANGIKTHFIEAGKGEPLILVHGGGPGDSGEHNWGNNVPALARHFHVFAIDMLGFGLTDKPPVEYSYQARIDHLAAFIDTLCLDRVCLAGNSMGSYIVVRYALDHPGRVKKLLMVATATVTEAMGLGGVSELGKKTRARVGEEPDADAMRAWLELLLHNRDKVSRDLIEDRIRLASLPGAVQAQRSYWEYGAKMRDDPSLQQWFDIRHRLPRLTIPMAIVWGKEDRFAPVDLAYKLREALPSLREFHLIENAGHQLQNDQPELFNEIASRFFLARD